MAFLLRKIFFLFLQIDQFERPLDSIAALVESFRTRDTLIDRDSNDWPSNSTFLASLALPLHPIFVPLPFASMIEPLPPIIYEKLADLLSAIAAWLRRSAANQRQRLSDEEQALSPTSTPIPTQTLLLATPATTRCLYCARPTVKEGVCNYHLRKDQR